MTKWILCDYKLTDKDYKCPKLSSDDWDELEDPCIGCSHKICKKVEE